MNTDAELTTVMEHHDDGYPRQYQAADLYNDLVGEADEVAEKAAAPRSPTNDTPA